MRVNFDDIRILHGSLEKIENFTNLKNLSIFCESVIDYLNTLSKGIFSDPRCRKFPDLITFGFWIRKASLLSMRDKYNNFERIGRGVVFHISPSNVPINFAYSLVAGLLSGNANIVRLSSKAFEQVDILCEIINKIDHEISNYIVLLQYPHNKQITDYFSFLADTRIIWGGDETIENIRTSPLKPRANEITFADRNSMCIINSDEYLKHRNKDSLAVGFYNDTYLFDQNACTAPKIIIWEGKGIEKARSIFNAHLHNVVLEKYKQSPIQSVQKYLKFTYFATQFDHCTLEKKDNLLYFIRIGELTSSLDKYFSNSGFFFEYFIKKDFDELIPLFSEKMQTISYFGVDIELLKKTIYEHHVRGVDRILPIGQTLDFNLVWDGFDLISSMSRSITII